MAYPTVSAPYGLKPVNRVDGLPYAGATRYLPIGSSNDTTIFYGDVVKLVGGLVVKDVGTDAATPIGVFMGCTYTDPNSQQKLFKQYYPADTAASDIQAYVVDDPFAVFKVAVVTVATTTMNGVASTAIGSNGMLVQNTGSTISGNSSVGIASAIGTTTTQPLRIVGLVEETKNAAGSYTEVLVVWNFGMHRYLNTTGTA
jgi:hypothetical protein